MSYNFDKIATEAKHIDSRYTWVSDDQGFIHIYQRRDYFSQNPFMTVAFHQNCGISSKEELITIVNALCQTLSDFDYKKQKKGKKSNA